MRATFLSAVSAIALLVSSGTAMAADELTIGYFPEWPLPFQYAQKNDIYDTALGVKVKWVPFKAGSKMSTAVASGDAQIAISMGVTSFLVAVSSGQDIQAIDVSVGYSDIHNCVVRESLGIDKTNAKKLEGKRVGLPLRTAAHADFLAQMEHFEVDLATLNFINMTPVESAAALADGTLDMACGWGAPLFEMKKIGSPLLSGVEKEAVTGKVYDVTAVNASWAEENADLVARFLHLTHKMNEEFSKGRVADMLPDIAEQSGMSLADAKIATSVFVFPSVEAQLSKAWLGGFMARDFKTVMNRLAEGDPITALDSYEDAVNTQYLKAASEL